MPKKRAYTLKERAESQEATRQRIVEAAVELHEKLGPRATSISAIAERAGVQRLTVYRHFPTERDIYQACSSHWMSLHPPPGPELWETASRPIERVRIALEAFYAYYAATRGMWARVHEDAHDVVEVRAPLASYADYLATIADELVRSFGLKRRAKSLRATLEHALAFPAWADLDSRHLSDKEKVGLVLSWMDGVIR